MYCPGACLLCACLRGRKLRNKGFLWNETALRLSCSVLFGIVFGIFVPWLPALFCFT